MLEKDGIVTREMFEEKLPSEERRKKGPYVIMECFQEIPCNPCSTSCKFQAVKANENINELPQVEIERCVGCGSCVSVCPGQACFVINEAYEKPGKITITLPYEMIPVPKKGDMVKGLNRIGEAVTDALVVAIRSGAAVDKTHVVTVEVEDKYLYDVRSIRVAAE